MDLSLTRTKIIATLGPASSGKKQIKALIQSGVDVFRLNMSHGNAASHRKLVKLIRETSDKMGEAVAIMMDLQGPKVRTAPNKDDQAITLTKNSSIFLSSKLKESCSGHVGIVLPGLEEVVRPGDPIVLSDGSLRLVAEKIFPDKIKAKVEVGGQLFSRKGVHLPSSDLPLPALSETDLSNAKLGIRLKVDWFAQSFVRTAMDIRQLKTFLEKNRGAQIPILAKIEDRFGVQHLGEILDVADGILVARGDMGVCLPQEQVPILQKDIILRTHLAGKPVVTATQMLESMIDHRNPTRAEVNDIANAILDGTSAVMLSAETAAGQYPVESAAQMERVCSVTENSYPFVDHFRRSLGPEEFEPVAAMAYATREVARLNQAEGIICLARTGSTARWLSRYRPTAPIFPICTNQVLARQLLMYWGVIPIIVPGPFAKADKNLRDGIRILKKRNAIKKGSPILVVRGGSRMHLEKSNTIQVIEVP